MNSTDVRDYWAERSGEYSPTYYAHHGPNRTSEAIYDVLDEIIERSAPVLELGCSAGRHLSYLQDHGFEDLYGIELNPGARDVMIDTYPGLAAAGTFHFEPIEAVIEDFTTDRFAAVYSVETLQHLHPRAEWVFQELARVTRDILVIAEHDGGTDAGNTTDAEMTYVNGDVPLYYRDWPDLFADAGFDEVDKRAGQRNTVRTFATPAGQVTDGLSAER